MMMNGEEEENWEGAPALPSAGPLLISDTACGNCLKITLGEETSKGRRRRGKGRGDKTKKINIGGERGGGEEAEERGKQANHPILRFLMKTLVAAGSSLIK